MHFFNFSNKTPTTSQPSRSSMPGAALTPQGRDDTIGKARKDNGIITNKADPNLVSFNQENSPYIYSTFHKSGRFPLTIGYGDPEYPPGRNEFDRQLLLAEQQSGYFRRQEEQEVIRQQLIRQLREMQGLTHRHHSSYNSTAGGDDPQQAAAGTAAGAAAAAVSGDAAGGAAAAGQGGTGGVPNSSMAGQVSDSSVALTSAAAGGVPPKKKPVVIVSPSVYQPPQLAVGSDVTALPGAGSVPASSVSYLTTTNVLQNHTNILGNSAPPNYAGMPNSTPPPPGLSMSNSVVSTAIPGVSQGTSFEHSGRSNSSRPTLRLTDLAEQPLSDIMEPKDAPCSPQLLSSTSPRAHGRPNSGRSRRHRKSAALSAEATAAANAARFYEQLTQLHLLSVAGVAGTRTYAPVAPGCEAQWKHSASFLPSCALLTPAAAAAAAALSPRDHHHHHRQSAGIKSSPSTILPQGAFAGSHAALHHATSISAGAGGGRPLPDSHAPTSAPDVMIALHDESRWPSQQSRGRDAAGRQLPPPSVPIQGGSTTTSALSSSSTGNAPASGVHRTRRGTTAGEDDEDEVDAAALSPKARPGTASLGDNSPPIGPLRRNETGKYVSDTLHSSSVVHSGQSEEEFIRGGGGPLPHGATHPAAAAPQLAAHTSISQSPASHPSANPHLHRGLVSADVPGARNSGTTTPTGGILAVGSPHRHPGATPPHANSTNTNCEIGIDGTDMVHPLDRISSCIPHCTFSPEKNPEEGESVYCILRRHRPHPPHPTPASQAAAGGGGGATAGQAGHRPRGFRHHQHKPSIPGAISQIRYIPGSSSSTTPCVSKRNSPGASRELSISSQGQTPAFVTPPQGSLVPSLLPPGAVVSPLPGSHTAMSSSAASAAAQALQLMRRDDPLFISSAGGAAPPGSPATACGAGGTLPPITLASPAHTLLDHPNPVDSLHVELYPALQYVTEAPTHYCFDYVSGNTLEAMQREVNRADAELEAEEGKVMDDGDAYSRRGAPTPDSPRTLAHKRSKRQRRLIREQAGTRQPLLHRRETKKTSGPSALGTGYEPIVVVLPDGSTPFQVDDSFHYDDEEDRFYYFDELQQQYFYLDEEQDLFYCYNEQEDEYCYDVDESEDDLQMGTDGAPLKKQNSQLSVDSSYAMGAGKPPRPPTGGESQHQHRHRHYLLPSTSPYGETRYDRPASSVALPLTPGSHSCGRIISAPRYHTVSNTERRLEERQHELPGTSSIGGSNSVLFTLGGSAAENSSDSPRSRKTSTPPHTAPAAMSGTGRRETPLRNNNMNIQRYYNHLQFRSVAAGAATRGGSGDGTAGGCRGGSARPSPRPHTHHVAQQSAAKKGTAGEGTEMARATTSSGVLLSNRTGHRVCEERMSDLLRQKESERLHVF